MGWRAVAPAALAVVALVAAPSVASPSISPCTHGYSYAGNASRHGADGVAATITAVQPPVVYTGHAAAWVGVGGIHQGPGGASEWIQAGLAAFPGSGLHLYVEEVSRGEVRRFVDLGRAVQGRRYRVRVAETGRDVWRAFVEGRPAGAAAYLPTGGGSWRAVATAESWAAGRANCNRYAYRFEAVAVRHSNGWAKLGAAQRVGAAVSQNRAGFSASY